MSIKEEISATAWMNPAGTAPPPARAHAHGQANNFDSVRLFAALLVLCSHHFFFLGRAQPAPTGNTLGEMAVMMFFVISGYLVSESWYRDPHIVRFILRRLLRLWPALAVATLAITLVSALITTLPMHAYFGHGTQHFIARNLQLRTVYQLPGVFGAHPGSPMSAVNGSWWTIPLEMKCYLYLAGLGLIGLRRRWLSLAALGIVAMMYFKTLPGHPHADAYHHLAALYMGFFMTGVCALQFGRELSRFRVPGTAIALVAFVAAIATGQRELAQWLAIAPLTLIIGSLSTPGLRSAARFGDLSYGIYLYAYFVQQVIIRLWPGTPTFAGSLLVSVAVTSALAWCSWHAVEAPALGLKRRLRRWFPDQAA